VHPGDVTDEGTRYPLRNAGVWPGSTPALSRRGSGSRRGRGTLRPVGVGARLVPRGQFVIAVAFGDPGRARRAATPRRTGCVAPSRPCRR
jgi:hypothetical protein